MRLMIVMLVASACLVLAGCSQEEAQAPAEQSSAPASKTPETTDIYSKVEKAAEETGEKVSAMAQQAEEKVKEAGAQVQAAAKEMTGAAASGQEVYSKACVSCHKMGIAGAPKTGDQEVWKPLIDKGMDQLAHNAINGIGKMPAKGGNASLSDAEVQAAVEYMVEQSQ